jgi:ubiquinone/menaquinone biosynthesis C-methylase UbiE
MEHQEYLQNARFPMGQGGREVLDRMRDSHHDVTTWTLSLLSPEPGDTILDIGCGGGRALKRLSSLVPDGKLYGVDYAETAVACTKEENEADIASGKLTVVQGSVSALPFPDNTFDKIFSIESYYFWPDLQNDVKEILRVLKPGGRVFIAADIHGDANLDEAALQNIRSLNMTNLTFQQFREVLEQGGYCDVTIHGKDVTDWMCGSGAKPTK